MFSLLMIISPFIYIYGKLYHYEQLVNNRQNNRQSIIYALSVFLFVIDLLFVMVKLNQAKKNHLNTDVPSSDGRE